MIGELLANALTHTPRGGSLTVTVTVTGPADGAATVVVRDTGTGFDPADADRIFRRFQHGQHDVQHGGQDGQHGQDGHGGQHGQERRSGLGLALAREVIAAHPLP